MIGEMLAGRRPDSVLVDCGPGSFTGVRVGLAAAHGLAIGWGVKLAGYSSMAAVAAAKGRAGGEIAVALEGGKGLIVPVIKNAEGMNLLGVARAIKDIAAKARDKKLLPQDVQGGTFTITNPGSFGTFHGTPVISQPQAGILGTYALVKRPWIVQDELGQDTIAIRPINSTPR